MDHAKTARFRLLCLCAGAVLQVAGPAIAQPGGGGPPPTPVIVDAARIEDVEQSREVTGELRAVQRSLLAAEEDGLVIALMHEEGDAVKKGDVIAQLRDTYIKLEIQRVEAELAMKRALILEREADLDKAKRDVARMDELQSRASGVQSEVEDRRTLQRSAEARLDAAKSDLSVVQSQLDLARERLARMTLIAPFSGRIIAKRTEVGQWLSKGSAVVELLALDQVDAWLDVPEKYIDRLAESKSPIRIRVLATGKILEAPYSAIIPDADPLSRLFPVRIRLANPDGHLRPRMSIIGLIPTGSREPTLTIHKDAILRNDAGEYVIYNAGGTGMAASVRSLFPVGDRTAVQSATLKPGMEIVIEGNERLMPGMPIAPTTKAPAAAPGGGH